MAELTVGTVQCDFMNGRLRCLRTLGHTERHRFAPTKDLQAPESTTTESTTVENSENPADTVHNQGGREPFQEPPRRMAHALSRVDNDLLIAWDTCGECLHHITTCGCGRGPTPPKWMDKFFQRNQPGLTAVEVLQRQTLEPSSDVVEEAGPT